MWTSTASNGAKVINNPLRPKLELPFIYEDEYYALDYETRAQLEYSNPCNTEIPGVLRVGEVFDDYLGYWREASISDF